jgi:hypothetical protein
VTLFLQHPGAPLDNNLVERALKKAILNRKGARVGDLFMSLIHTCELHGANPFDSLTELQRHGGELPRNPSEWSALELPRDSGAAGHPGSRVRGCILPGRKGSFGHAE